MVHSSWKPLDQQRPDCVEESREEISRRRFKYSSVTSEIIHEGGVVELHLHKRPNAVFSKRD